VWDQICTNLRDVIYGRPFSNITWWWKCSKMINWYLFFRRWRPWSAILHDVQVQHAVRRFVLGQRHGLHGHHLDRARREDHHSDLPADGQQGDNLISILWAAFSSVKLRWSYWHTALRPCKTGKFPLRPYRNDYEN